MGRYDDIIDINWMGSPTKARMSLENRAKIFLPFAALKGFEEAIENKDKIILENMDCTSEGADEFITGEEL